MSIKVRGKLIDAFVLKIKKNEFKMSTVEREFCLSDFLLCVFGRENNQCGLVLLKRA